MATDKPTLQDLMVTLLGEQIANLGYPVGCGMKPHPETLSQMADYAIRLVDGERAEDSAS